MYHKNSLHLKASVFINLLTQWRFDRICKPNNMEVGLTSTRRLFCSKNVFTISMSLALLISQKWETTSYFFSTIYKLGIISV